jgi:hypothetical protein
LCKSFLELCILNDEFFSSDVSDLWGISETKYVLICNENHLLISLIFQYSIPTFLFLKMKELKKYMHSFLTDWLFINSVLKENLELSF